MRFPLSDRDLRWALALTAGAVGLIAGLALLRGTESSTLGWQANQGVSRHSLLVGGVRRTYLLQLPRGVSGASGARQVPLLVLLHGSGSDGDEIRGSTGMDSVAERHGLVVAYPDGAAGWISDLTDWNAGSCCGPAQEHDVDDVGFIRALIDDLARHLPIAPRRIYVAGFSDGGRMSYRVGCELSREVAAIGVVSGSITLAHCRPARPLPLIAFHGTADPSVPFDDSLPSTIRSPVALAPVTAAAGAALPPSVRFWAATDRCGAPTTTPLTTTVTRTTFAGCVADVVFYAIAGGTHEWPAEASERLVTFFLRR